MKKQTTETENNIVLRKKSKRLKDVTADAEAIEKLAGYGLNEKEIASVYSITEKQFLRAQKRSRLLAEVMNRGKDIAAKMVMEALFRRATGFEREEIEHTSFKGKIHEYTVTKFYPPDIRAIEFWLKNRTPLQWKAKVDKLRDDHIQKLREYSMKSMERSM